MPATEVVKKAKEKKLKMTAAYVYNVRSWDRARAKKKDRAAKRLASSGFVRAATLAVRDDNFIARDGRIEKLAAEIEKVVGELVKERLKSIVEHTMGNMER